MSYEHKIKELGLKIPEIANPVAIYVPAVKVGGYVYTSGQLPVVQGALKYQGKVGQDLKLADAYDAAKICALNCLAAIKGLTGSIEAVEQIVKITGFVNSADGFTEQPKVINGASELLGSIFGTAGEHARSAVGVSELPLNAAVEIEMIVKVSQ